MASLHNTIFIIFSIVVALSHLSLASKVHIVGESGGWDAGTTDYAKWASSKTFNVGDTLVFKYLPSIHNVMQVTQKDFESCNPPAKAIATYTSGKDTVILKTSGDFYFICSAPGHCDAGQKVHVKVGQGSAPAMSPMSSSSSSSTPPPTSSSSAPSMSKSPSEPISKSPSGSPSVNVISAKAPSPSSGAMAVAPSKALLYTLSMAILAMLFVVNVHH
ncbi:hypothetical protein Scep_030386 [Stephania cephalantha]|uniref:Phytocyanin domain-containing protein n=1 Tax=Stephania cephalantha TaxID=152367 RepID=A0AAP0E2C8_9MAGN